MLSINSVTVSYGKLRAIQDVSIQVADRDLVAVIGSNGAGKTTLLRAISGLNEIASGTIEFDGKRLDGLAPRHICEMGIVHVPEGRRIFPLMNVMENLQLGAYLSRARKMIPESLEQVYSLFPVLRERRKQSARTLSGGEQQMLAIGRGLMGRPSLMILDEPTMSLSPKLSADILETLRTLNAEGIAVLLVSQEVLHSLELARMAYVIENGRITLQGAANELSASEHVRKAYLGL
ncbi:MAG: ABC transporter ATP-binding protein [Thermodesulfobacteriota bacterium]